MWIFLFFIFRGDYIKSNLPVPPHHPAPRVGCVGSTPRTPREGSLIWVYWFRICFSFQEVCCKCGAVYLRFRFINFMFQISILRNSILIPLPHIFSLSPFHTHPSLRSSQFQIQLCPNVSPPSPYPVLSPALPLHSLNLFLTIISC